MGLQFPDPVIKIAIEPKSKADLEKMSNGLIKLAQEDPSFHFSRDEETNQTVIEGMGELHLVRPLCSNPLRILYASFLPLVCCIETHNGPPPSPLRDWKTKTRKLYRY